MVIAEWRRTATALQSLAKSAREIEIFWETECGSAKDLEGPLRVRRPVAVAVAVAGAFTAATASRRSLR